MPYEIDWQGKGQVTRFSGHVTGAELVRYLEEVAADPRFDEIRFSITDWSLVSSGDVTAKDLAYFAALSSAHRLSNPRVLEVEVAPQPSVREMLTSWRVLHPAPHLVALVSTFEEACRWVEANLHLLDQEPYRFDEGMRRSASA